MKYEKILKREDGTQYQIHIDAHLDAYRNSGIEYRTNVFVREKGKRKWSNVDMTIGDYEYRKLNMSQRREFDDINILRFVTEDEIYDAKIELWESLKPKK